MKTYTIVFFLWAMASACLGMGAPYDLDYRGLMTQSVRDLVQKGNAYYSRNVLDSALICYSVVSGRYSPNMPDEEKAACAYAYFRSGNIHYKMYSYVRAQDMYFRSMEIGHDCGADSLMVRVYNNLGNVYSSFYDFDKAVDFYKKAYATGVQLGDSALKMKLLANLIGVYSNLNDNDTLAHYLKVSEQELKDTDNSYFYLSGKGVWLGNEGEYARAVKLHRQALRLAERQQLDGNYACSALCNMADAFAQLHRNDSAEHCLKRCAALAEQSGLLDMQMTAYRKLAELCSQQKRAGEFMHYTNLYRSIDDSIQMMQGYRNLKDVEFLFEMNQIDKKIQSLQMEQMLKEERYAMQRVFLYIVLAGLVVIAVLLLVTYKQKRSLESSYEDLFKRNAEIVEAEKRRKQRYQQYEEDRAERERLVQELQEQLAACRHTDTERPATAEAHEPEAAEGEAMLKYQGSPIGQEQREQLLQAINDVMENTLEFCSVDFTLERMAVLTHSKSKYVSQVINETYGKNFNRFVNEYRIREARSRLLNRAEYGQYTVKAIALSVGFKSNTNFNQLFKEMTGITPSMYISMANK